MTTTPDPIPWTPLAALAGRFAANVAALVTRDAALAEQLSAAAVVEPYHIRPTADGIVIGVGHGSPRPVPCRVTPPVARSTAAQLCPTGGCDAPLLVAGEDYGWLWDRLYRTPCNPVGVPGWRPPLYFVLPDLDRLRLLLHVHDWRDLLADARVQLFAGPTAVDRLRHAMATDAACPLPARWVTVDPTIWAAFEPLIAEAVAVRLADRAGTPTAGALTAETITADAIAAGRPLRVLGLTSRYTTFLQHSMRDWLAAFDRLGHATRLVIESADHQLVTGTVAAAAAAEFQPDLIVAIDHLRHEYPGLPHGVPFVGWVQDHMPHLHTANAGRQQGTRDYTIGYGRAKLTHAYGYPPSRFLSCAIPANDVAFPADGPVDPALACDVSYVSHASVTAEAVFTNGIADVADPVHRRALRAAYDRLTAVYAGGGSVSETAPIGRMVDAAFADAGLALTPAARSGVVDLFVQRVNNAMFRHQTLAWVAGLGVDLRLYGNGWDRHPTLARFARGPITDPAHLAVVHRSSRIGLQVSPFGTVHQRVFEGLCAGGFFLLRYCPGDVMERDYRAVWDWCRANGVTTDAQLLAAAASTPAVAARVAAIAGAWQHDAFDLHAPLTELLRMSDAEGYIKSAGMIFGDDYDAVTFATAAQLADRVAQYLGDAAGRRTRAASMRATVAGRFTYAALARQVIGFIADDQRSRQHYRTAA